jgi:hypothetical protein
VRSTLECVRLDAAFAFHFSVKARRIGPQF